MNRLAVLGHPVAHSLSPRMHGAAFAALDMAESWSYDAIDVAAGELPALLRRMGAEGYRGANVTIPHKRAALELADDASPAAVAIGAANTLSFGSGGIMADNTDAPGLIAALPLDPSGHRALVLGAGGAARAAVWALLGAGARVAVHNRTESRARELVGELGGEIVEANDASLWLGDFEILVNATSVGLARPGAAASPPGADLKALGLEADELSDLSVVVDLVYGTEATELTAAGSRGGADVVDGLEVLVRQGAESFQIWTGRKPPLEAMRSAVRETQE